MHMLSIKLHEISTQVIAKAKFWVPYVSSAIAQDRRREFDRPAPSDYGNSMTIHAERI